MLKRNRNADFKWKTNKNVRKRNEREQVNNFSSNVRYDNDDVQNNIDLYVGWIYSIFNLECSTDGELIDEQKKENNEKAHIIISNENNENNNERRQNQKNIDSTSEVSEIETESDEDDYTVCKKFKNDQCNRECLNTENFETYPINANSFTHNENVVNANDEKNILHYDFSCDNDINLFLQCSGSSDDSENINGEEKGILDISEKQQSSINALQFDSFFNSLRTEKEADNHYMMNLEEEKNKENVQEKNRTCDIVKDKEKLTVNENMDTMNLTNELCLVENESLMKKENAVMNKKKIHTFSFWHNENESFIIKPPIAHNAINNINNKNQCTLLEESEEIIKNYVLNKYSIKYAPRHLLYSLSQVASRVFFDPHYRKHLFY